MAEIAQESILRRVLLKTKPVPYAIWMAGLGTIAGSWAAIFGWVMARPSNFRPIWFLIPFCSSLGCFMGLFVVRKLPWLATFGDVIEKGGEPKPQENREKAKAQ